VFDAAEDKKEVSFPDVVSEFRLPNLEAETRPVK